MVHLVDEAAIRTSPDLSWQPLYRWGGVSAWVYVALVLIPVTLVFVAPLPPAEGRAVLDYIAAHRVVYLVELVCFVGLSIPALVVFAALAVSLARPARGLAAIGGLFGISSEIIALAVGSSPESLHGGLVLLSDAYTSATSEAERLTLVGAADALVAIANAMPWAGVLTAAGILVLSLAMWRGDSRRGLAVLGIVAGVLGMVSEVLRPVIGVAYLLYGLLLPVWFGWVGVVLLRVDAVRGGVGVAPVEH
ncbi:hypothetical protein [Raineyella fluvialis]|uniref:DUF4386 family protein n=1 Tax=Raineyella fluvialis TaxID=2662261 RepID=A0A5Q2FE87_9ACTN|nr:hypothetical protein [Raineyella fluvialis]QGF22566.1 hypothetical protein Rai3103_01435 [Raineyella fluvialis]